MSENNQKELTMADFEEEINASFVKFKEGDMIRGTVVAVDEEEIMIDLGSFSQGVIPKSEYSDDPDFVAMDEVRVGDTLSVMVLYEDEMGRTVLSLKQAREIESWEKLRQSMENKEAYEVKVSGVVPSGVVAYVEGIRGFVPASQLAMTYVEEGELDEYVGKKIKVQVITVEEDKNKLVLSAKNVLRAEAVQAHEVRLNALEKGYVTTGVITRIEPYGCFVEIGEDLTGLVHISQICNRFLKSPREVVKLGMEVKVKVLSVEDGKIRLSMKEAEDIAPEMEDTTKESEEENALEYKDEGEAMTSLASLLKGIKLDE